MSITPVHYIAVPLAAAFLIPILSKFHKETARIIPGLVFSYFLVISFVLMRQVSNTGIISETIAGWRAPWGINLVFGYFSGFFATLMSVIGFLTWLYSYRFKLVDSKPAMSYYILLMMLVTGSIGIVITGDIFNMFVFLEIVAISAFSLTSFYPGRDGAEAAFKYLLIASFSSFLILLAVLLLYTQTGTLNIAELSTKVHLIPQSLKLTILVMFVVGLGIESELFPLNGWAPDAYSQAPAPVGAVFAGVVVKGGIYATMRVMFTMFEINEMGQILLILGLITTIIAEVAAIKQTQVKRMLAYSSIGQMGVVMMAIGIGTEDAVFAALFMMFNHAIIKSLLFFSTGFLLHNSLTKTIAEMKGVAKKFPVLSFMFALGSFAIVGLPPFSGFWSKLYFLMAAADAKLFSMIALILAVSVVEIVYYFRVVGVMYYHQPDESLPTKQPGLNAYFVMGILAALIIGVGVYPDLITNFLHAAAYELTHKTEYVQTVLTQFVR